MCIETDVGPPLSIQFLNCCNVLTIRIEVCIDQLGKGLQCVELLDAYLEEVVCPGCNFRVLVPVRPAIQVEDVERRVAFDMAARDQNTASFCCFFVFYCDKLRLLNCARFLR